MPQQSDTSNRPGAAVLNSVMSFLTTHMNRCIDGWRAGDRAAADELIRRTQNRFRHLAEKMYRGFPNVRVVGEADDLFTVGWMRLLRSLMNIRPLNTNQFFLLAGVELHRELLDMARKAKTPKYRVQPLALVGSGGDSSVYQVAGPVDPADKVEMWECFHEGVETLDKNLRDVVILHFYNDLPYTEIATTLGKHERTIRRWWKDACLELRAYVRRMINPEWLNRPD